MCGKFSQAKSSIRNDNDVARAKNYLGASLGCTITALSCAIIIPILFIAAIAAA